MPDRRLYLFDIDGTLISTGGAGGAAMRAAFAALWRIEDGFNGVEFTGRSDFAIIGDALRAAALDGDTTAMRRFKRAYYRRLPEMLRTTEGRVLPGVVPLLDTLKLESSVTLALGTGNFRHGARHKLQHYGLWHYFRHGGFGDRTGDRPTLISYAIRAANRAAGRHATVFVIGDTVRDIEAAKANNAVAVGVATGSNTQEQLAAAGADIVLATLEDASDLLPKGS